MQRAGVQAYQGSGGPGQPVQESPRAADDGADGLDTLYAGQFRLGWTEKRWGFDHQVPPRFVKGLVSLAPGEGGLKSSPKDAQGRGEQQDDGQGTVGQGVAGDASEGEGDPCRPQEAGRPGRDPCQQWQDSQQQEGRAKQHQHRTQAQADVPLQRPAQHVPFQETSPVVNLPPHQPYHRQHQYVYVVPVYEGHRGRPGPLLQELHYAKAGQARPGDYQHRQAQKSPDGAHDEHIRR